MPGAWRRSRRSPASKCCQGWSSSGGDAATTPDPTLASHPSTTAWFGPALAQKAYCEANRGDLMLPGRAGYEHCMQYGF
ncbi:MAG: hypothetical protein IPG94_20915 [Kineosporiaceae bacterium]|nr:hypothetical protein [Kineosporiaceae bacterium]